MFLSSHPSELEPWKRTFVLIMLALIVSCIQKKTDSDVAHKSGDLLQEKVPWHFAKVPEGELARDSREKLPASHPQVVRARKTSERVWQAALDIDPRISLAKAQKPISFVVKQYGINAWVNSTRLCIRNGPAEPKSGALLGSNFRFYIPQQNCYEPTQPLSANAFVTWFNEQGVECKIKAKERGFEFNSQCNGAFKEAPLIMLPVPEPAITFTLPLLEETSDDELTYVVAHEMGHYLRTHHMYLEKNYNYFFKDNENARRIRPMPDPTFVEKGQRLVQLYETGRRTDVLGSSRGLKPNEERDGLYAEAAQRGLGFYTTEQEADEIAIEIMKKLLVNAGAAIDFQLRRLKNPERAWKYDFEKCSALLRNNNLEQGKKSPLALEGLDDPHHNPCYRAWNMQQEISAHR